MTKGLQIVWMVLAVAVLGLVASVLALVPALAAGDDDSVGVADQTTGIWYLRSPNGQTTSFYFGDPGDVPIMGDWNCDDIDTPGLYRQSDGYVYLRNSNTRGPADVKFFFGNPGDLPLAGDFNADGCDTVSIYPGRWVQNPNPGPDTVGIFRPSHQQAGVQ